MSNILRARVARHEVPRNYPQLVNWMSTQMIKSGYSVTSRPFTRRKTVQKGKVKPTK